MNNSISASHDSAFDRKLFANLIISLKSAVTCNLLVHFHQTEFALYTLWYPQGKGAYLHTDLRISDNARWN